MSKPTAPRRPPGRPPIANPLTAAQRAKRYRNRKAARLAERLGETADIARDFGLAVNAGHDLTVANLPALVTRIPDLAEVSIGHGLTADALEYGMAETVRRFCRACGQDV